MSAQCCTKEEETRSFEETAESQSVSLTRSPRTSGAIAAVAALLLDQASKAVVFANIRGGEEVVVVPLLSIVPGWNPGTAFGLAQGAAPLLLVVIALAVCAWLAALIIKSRSPFEGAALGAAIGGALGNVADRIRFGAVRDFIDVHWSSLHWPTFNAADMFVVGGLLLFAFAEIYRQRRQRDPAV